MYCLYLIIHYDKMIDIKRLRKKSEEEVVTLLDHLLPVYIFSIGV